MVSVHWLVHTVVAGVIHSLLIMVWCLVYIHRIVLIKVAAPIVRIKVWVLTVVVIVAHLWVIVTVPVLVVPVIWLHVLATPVLTLRPIWHLVLLLVEIGCRMTGPVLAIYWCPKTGHWLHWVVTFGGMLVPRRVKGGTLLKRVTGRQYGVAGEGIWLDEGGTLLKRVTGRQYGVAGERIWLNKAVALWEGEAVGKCC